MIFIFIISFFFINHSVLCTNDEKQNELEKVKIWLKSYNRKVTEIFNEHMLARWAHSTNMTNHNLKMAIDSGARTSDFKMESAQNASRFNESLIEDKTILRELTKIKTMGTVLNYNDSLLLGELKGNMSGIYGTATICSIDVETLIENCSIQWSLEPEIQEFMATVKNYDALSQVWKTWHDTVGRPMKNQYVDMVQLSNKGARAGGFKDTGDFWRWPYEDPEFEKTIEDLWLQILPMYEQLHTYVRRRLRKKLYPNRFNTSAIPAHLFGDIWGQDWSNLFQSLAPFPEKISNLDVTKAMLEQNYTVLKMFQISDKFFTSLGLIPMPAEFWNKSMFEKPNDGRQVLCHASAWDFHTPNDFRIKMCTRVNMDYLITIHHEMGHVQYYLNFRDLPFNFRDGANPGFHEAIGDTIALSSSNPYHLKAIGLLPNYTSDYEQDINFLFKMALVKIAFLPFGYLIDKWRWEIFRGSEYNESHDLWNDRWWQMRYDFQGVLPPTKRSKDDFDPGAKYHVPAHRPYASYFISFVLQFQFYQAMCQAANHQGPLHTCDFYKSKEAGDLLAGVLKLGSSEPWPTAMKKMTGRTQMDALALLEYFRPLREWLGKENELNGDCFGWGKQWPLKAQSNLSKPRCDFFLND